MTEDETLTKIMRHVRAVHTWDWFELEEIHATARSLLTMETHCASEEVHGDRSGLPLSRIILILPEMK